MNHLRGWRGQRLGFDTETTGLSWSTGDRMVGTSVWCRDFGYYFPFRHHTGNLPEHLITPLIEELERHDLDAFNTKFDVHILSNDGMTWPKKQRNVHLLSHLADENEDSLELKGLCEKHFGSESVQESKKLDALLAERKLKKGDIKNLASWEVAPYAVADAKLTRELGDFQQKRVAAWKLEKIAEELSDYERITYFMEKRGLLLDKLVVQTLEDRAIPSFNAEKKALSDFFGEPVNPRSHRQIKKLLGTPDTKDETLEYCRHPMAERVRRARKWGTMVSNYCNPYREYCGTDGAVHPNYNLGGTVAGRPSCTSPNLQGVARSDEVYRVKDCFIARPGYCFISADYSQAELRLAAHYTGDPTMKKILADGGDVHGATAVKCKIDRDFAKRINFGISYGLGAPGLSRQLHISLEEAAKLIRAWNSSFPQFKVMRNRVVRNARDHGYIRMWTGRVRRFIPEPSKVSPPHKAFSSLIQGGVAEILRYALCRLDKMGCDTHIVLQVYDQILFEVPINMVKPVAAEIRRTMEDFPFTTKLKVDLSYGPTWGKLEKIKE